jgi:hypothetical protein
MWPYAVVAYWGRPQTIRFSTDSITPAVHGEGDCVSLVKIKVNCTKTDSSGFVEYTKISRPPNNKI